jgi:hypothetical protein
VNKFFYFSSAQSICVGPNRENEYPLRIGTAFLANWIRCQLNIQAFRVKSKFNPGPIAYANLILGGPGVLEPRFHGGTIQYTSSEMTCYQIRAIVGTCECL